MRKAAFLGALALSHASCGTLSTRLPAFAEDSETHLVGWPLFEAVHEDWWWVSGNSTDCKAEAMWPILVPFYLVSLPFDIAGDLVLLPLDVVAGLFGWSRERVQGGYDAAQQGAAADDRPQAGDRG